MSFSNGPKGIIGDGLVYTIDAANPQSYNSGSGVTYDFFNQTLSGSLDGNGTTYSTDGIGSFEFDGTDDYIEFPSLDVLSGKTQLTISTWHKPVADESGIVALWGDTAGSFQGSCCLLYYQGSNQLLLEVGSDGSNDYIYKSSLSSWMPKGSWHDLTFVFDSTQSTNATKIKMYVNGELQTWTGNNFGFSGWSSSASNWRLATDKTSYAAYDFEGNIAKQLIYNRPLTAAEVLQNYNSQKTRFGL